VRRMVVNGSCEADWPDVLALAGQYRQVIPVSAIIPGMSAERTPEWKANLTRFLDSVPSAVGEIGLDRWKPGLAYAGQEEVFVGQMRLASARNRPVSIHACALGAAAGVAGGEPASGLRLSAAQLRRTGRTGRTAGAAGGVLRPFRILRATR